jgi:putative endonuclease
MLRFSYVYMMGSSSRRALYTGVGASLHKRVYEHKTGQGGYFTSKYKCHRLVYFEQFTNIEAAIEREKQIKGWSRAKKNGLVETLNPGWKDLAADWYPKKLLRDGKPVAFENEAQGPSPLLRRSAPFVPETGANGTPKPRAVADTARDDES